LKNKFDEELIVTTEDTLRMLDNIIDRRDNKWWNEFYLNRKKEVPFFKNIPDENLISYCQSHILNGGKALDIGCGNGRNSLYLSEHGFNVTGIDFSANSIK